MVFRGGIDELTLITEIIEEIQVIDPAFSDSGDVEVLFPRKDGGLYRIADGTAEPIDTIGGLGLGNVLKMALTPMHAGELKTQFLAIYVESDEMFICECKVKTGKVAKFPIEDGPPEAVVWCGADSAALAYADKVVLVGPNNAKAEFYIESFKGFYCYGEVDGIRVMTNGNCQFIEKVPVAIESAFATASPDPSAQIINAYQKYLAGDPRAEDALKSIKEDAKSSLPEGIKTLITAATAEFEPEYQKYLLKAASFAKNFISPGEFNSEDFVLTLKHLRIVNQLHVQKVSGAVVTFS